MNTHRRSERGQALILIVAAMVALIGITGLAIDGGNIYSDRRHAQNAADTAALAASLKRNGWEKLYGICGEIIDTTSTATPTCSASAITAAMNLALENGYNSNNVTNRVDVFSP